MRTTLISMMFWCVLGCAPDGGVPSGQPLSGERTPEDPQSGCETICASYDSSECRVVCPPPPVDASAPEDPYAGEPGTTPEPPAADAGATPQLPHDPYAS